MPQSSINEAVALANLLSDLGLVEDVIKVAHRDFREELEKRLIACSVSKRRLGDVKTIVDDDNHVVDKGFLLEVDRLFVTDPLEPQRNPFSHSRRDVRRAVHNCKRRLGNISVIKDAYRYAQEEGIGRLDEKVSGRLSSDEQRNYRILGNLYLYLGCVNKSLTYYSMLQSPDSDTQNVVSYLGYRKRKILRRKLNPKYAWRHYWGTEESAGVFREVWRDITRNVREEVIYGTLVGLTFGTAVGFAVTYLINKFR